MPLEKRSRRVLNKAAYFAYLAIACAVLLEIGLRLWYADLSYYWVHRYMFVSPTAFRNMDEGFWTYNPNREVREVAVYDFPHGNLMFRPVTIVEYDCHFTTNNLGFIGRKDVYPGDRVVLVLGDSFAAGQGGCPWMHMIEPPTPHLMLLNAGLMGTGFGNWGRMLPYLRQQRIEIAAVVVIAISNDFKRPSWQWDPGQLACIDTGTCEGAEYWHPTTERESPTSLMRRARDRSIIRNKEQSTLWVFKEWLKLHVYTYKVLEPVILAHREGANQVESDWETLSTLSELKNLDVPLRVLLVPQRDEVALGRKNSDSMVAQSVLREQSIPYTWCELGPGDYMLLDGHPSAGGYRKVAGCLEALLNEIEVR